MEKSMGHAASSAKFEVVVVGAGPVGLMLACEARAAGASVLVLDRITAPDATNAAVAIGPLAVAALDRRGLRDELFAPADTHRGQRWLRLERQRLVASLLHHAGSLGVELRCGHQVVGVRQSEGDVVVNARTRFAQYEVRALFLVGCDGSPSTVRALVGFDRHGKGSGMIPQGYRVDRVLLAGAAAHLHEPFDSERLTIGLLDAANLGWKLAAQVRGWAPRSLLDTYGDEVSQLVANAIAEVDMRYDLAGEHELVGTQCGDLKLTVERGFAAGRGGPTRLASLLGDGRGLLLDLADNPEMRELADGWGSRLRVVTARAERDDVRALLVRPDGCVAWALPSTAQFQARSLTRAIATWFGRPVRSVPPQGPATGSPPILEPAQASSTGSPR
jgi:2-polyprenyl-6-methoxyphenol hydroxylase-like FAD-dependent oxidoreductase